MVHLVENAMGILSYYLTGFRGLIKQKKSQSYAHMDFIAEELIRNVHSIEKGLCISNPRLGFGHEKQKEMLSQIQYLKDSHVPLHKKAVLMAHDAICEYIDYHQLNNYTDDFIELMKREIDSNLVLDNHMKCGGTVLFNRTVIDSIDKENVECFINSRHSIRDYSDEDVDDALLTKALLLAEKAPSACNRQGTRAYVIRGDCLNSLTKQMTDVGGFIEKAKRIIVITGKLNAYRLNETNQFVVSASMYTAYLTLTLHLYGLGACVIQRPVIWTKSGDVIRRVLGISDDEQIVCVLAVGMLKESCKVPVSYRLNEDIYKYIG